MPRIKPIFVNPRGHIRAGWRISIFIVVAAVISKLLYLGLSIVTSNQTPTMASGWWAVAMYAALSAAFIASSFITLRWIDRRPLRLLGLGFHSGWQREFLWGALLGFVLLSLVTATMAVAGLAEMKLNAVGWPLLIGFAQLFALFLLVAAFEELIARGYVFQALIEGTRPLFAAFLLSALFGLGHLNNPNATKLGALNVGLAGMLMAVTYLKTRALWMPIGLHLSWNFSQGFIYGHSVSGIPASYSILLSRPVGPTWLSGGAFGAEGSVVATLVLAVASFLLWKLPKLAPSEEMGALWRRYPGRVTSDAVTMEIASRQAGPANIE